MSRESHVRVQLSRSSLAGNLNSEHDFCRRYDAVLVNSHLSYRVQNKISRSQSQRSGSIIIAINRGVGSYTPHPPTSIHPTLD
eukprot:873499-Rhodomonas_salina.6